MKKVWSVVLALVLCLTAMSAAFAEPVTIEFFQMKDEGNDYYEALIAEFEKLNPDIKIEHTNVPDAETVLMTRMASEQVPDVFSTFPLEAAFREQVKAGFIMDLTGEKMLENVDDGILALSLLDGKAYSIPLSLNMLGVYYNLELFEKEGVTVPTTIDELYAVCEKLKAAGVTPFTFPDKDVWTVRQFCDRASVTMLADPVGLFEKIGAGETTAQDSAELRLMAETIVKLRTYGQEDNLGTGYEQSIADFANGKAAMFFSGTFAYPEIVKNNPALAFAMFRYPDFGTDAVTDRLGINVDTAFSISATTQYPEAAKKFVEFCCNPENAQKFSDYDGTPSAIKGVAFNKAEFDDMFVNYIQTGKTISVPANSWPAGFGGTYGNLNQELIDNGNVDAWLENLNTLILDSYNQ
ncbi:MAG: extracellular solute-binding protein [Clostridia bacterium]